MKIPAFPSVAQLIRDPQTRSMSAGSFSARREPSPSSLFRQRATSAWAPKSSATEPKRGGAAWPLSYYRAAGDVVQLPSSPVRLVLDDEQELEGRYLIARVATAASSGAA